MFNVFLLIFSDLLENSIEEQPSSAIGIKYKTNSTDTVTILLAKNSNRYRLQSNTLSSLNLAAEQLIYRLKKHYNNTDDFSLSLGSHLPGNEMASYIVKHFEKRHEVMVLEVSLSKYSVQAGFYLAICNY